MKLKLLISLTVVLLCGCTKENITAQTMTEKLYVTIGEETRSVTMEDNVGTQALVAALQAENITYEAHDYGNFEKVGALGQSFPTADHQVTTQLTTDPPPEASPILGSGGRTLLGLQTDMFSPSKGLLQTTLYCMELKETSS